MDFVRVPVCYPPRWFTAGTLPNCCHHPKESFYASLYPLFLFTRKPAFKQAKIFSHEVKGEGRFEFLIASIFQIISFFCLLSSSQWAILGILVPSILGQ